MNIKQYKDRYRYKSIKVIIEKLKSQFFSYFKKCNSSYEMDLNFVICSCELFPMKSLSGILINFPQCGRFAVI